MFQKISKEEADKIIAENLAVKQAITDKDYVKEIKAINRDRITQRASAPVVKAIKEQTDVLTGGEVSKQELISTIIAEMLLQGVDSDIVKLAEKNLSTSTSKVGVYKKLIEDLKDFGTNLEDATNFMILILDKAGVSLSETDSVLRMVKNSYKDILTPKEELIIGDIPEPDLPDIIFVDPSSSGLLNPAINDALDMGNIVETELVVDGSFEDVRQPITITKEGSGPQQKTIIEFGKGGKEYSFEFFRPALRLLLQTNDLEDYVEKNRQMRSNVYRDSIQKISRMFETINEDYTTNTPQLRLMFNKEPTRAELDQVFNLITVGQGQGQLGMSMSPTLLTLDDVVDRIGDIIGSISAGNNSKILKNELFNHADLLLGKGIINQTDHRRLCQFMN